MIRERGGWEERGDGGDGICCSACVLRLLLFGGGLPAKASWVFPCLDGAGWREGVDMSVSLLGERATVLMPVLLVALLMAQLSASLAQPIAQPAP